jgi:hypothetical protein
MTLDDVDNFFTYHPPIGDQAERYSKLRKAGHALAWAIYDYCPDGADRTAAIRKVREAVMTANAAIACGEVNQND